MTAETRAAEVLAVIDAHRYVPSLARGVSKCSCGLQFHGMPHDHRQHLVDEIAAVNAETRDDRVRCPGCGDLDVERVAEVICGAHEGENCRDWDHESAAWRNTYRDMARAVIAHVAAREDREGETVTEWGCLHVFPDGTRCTMTDHSELVRGLEPLRARRSHDRRSAAERALPPGFYTVTIELTEAEWRRMTGRWALTAAGTRAAAARVFMGLTERPYGIVKAEREMKEHS